MLRFTGCVAVATLLVAHAAFGVTQDFESGAADWSEVQGEWSVANGEYTQSVIDWTTTGTLETYHRSFFGDATWTDYTVEATVRIDEGGPVAPILGIFFRVTEKTDAGGYYLFRLDARPAEGPGLIKAPNETIQIIADQGAESGRDYVLKVEVEGSDIRCYVDGVLVIETTDDTFATGAVGVGTFDAVGTFDDVSVTGADIPSAVEAGGKLPTVWARLRGAY
jgi:hypothetical protein